MVDTLGNDAPEEGVQDAEAPLEGAQQALLEALIFAAVEPVSCERIAEVTGFSAQQVRQALVAIQERHADEASGFELVQIAGKFQFRTKVAFGKYVRELRAGAPRRLSAAALETLAIIAYRQPIVRGDVERIRGVDVTPTLKTLLDRSLVKIVGHQASIGQPALYGTTEEFLKLFGLNSLAELPSLRDLKEFEAEPGETQDISNDSDSSEPTKMGGTNENAVVA